jgi:hypothetical protein
MLSLYTYTFLASAEEVLIYPLNLFWGVTLENPVLQTTPQKKSQGVRSGERASQVPQLIIVPDIVQSLQTHTCSVGSSRVLLKPAIKSFLFC